MADELYYTHGGRHYGPVAGAELKELAAAGKLLPDDLIWKEGMEKWVPARSAKGLLPAAPAATPAATTPAGNDAPGSKPARPAPRPGPKNNNGGDDEPRPANPRDDQRGGRRKLGTPALVGMIGGGVLLLGLMVAGSVLLSGNKKPGEPSGSVTNDGEKQEGAAGNPVGRSWSEVGSVPWKGGLHGYALSPDGKSLAVAGNSLKLYDAATGLEGATLTNGYPRTPAYAGNGKTLAWYESGTKYGDSGVRVWDAGRKQVVTRINAHAAGGEVGGKATFAYTRPTLTPDGKLVVTSSRGDDRTKAPASEVKVWDAATGQLKGDLPGSDPVAISGDGRLLVMAGRNGHEVVVWNLATMAQETVVPLPKKGAADRLTHLSVHPDGKAFATVTNEGLIVWDAATGRQREHKLKFNATTKFLYCYSLDYSPDGLKLAVAVGRQFGGPNGVAYEGRVWDLATGAVAKFPDARGIEFASSGGVIACYTKDQFRVYAERPGGGAVGYGEPTDDAAGQWSPPPKDDTGVEPTSTTLTKAEFVQRMAKGAYAVGSRDGQKSYTFDNKADFFRKMGQPESSEEFDVKVPFELIGKIVTAKLTYRCTDGRLVLDIDHTSHSAWYTVLRVHELR